jgi:hypothetical protein
VEARDFIFDTRPDRQWGPNNILYNGYCGSFLGVKRPGRGFGKTTPSSPEVKERVKLYLYCLLPPCLRGSFKERNLTIKGIVDSLGNVYSILGMCNGIKNKERMKERSLSSHL